MAYKINLNDSVPVFTAIDEKGASFTLSSVKDEFIVLFFYPKDSTPGCTKEACSFRDSLEKIAELEAIIMGISPDSKESHQNFIEKQNLNFPLLCDENLEIAKLFDVVRLKEVEDKKVPFIERSTFIIGPNKKIAWLERPVSVDGHTQRVIDALKRLRQS